MRLASRLLFTLSLMAATLTGASAADIASMLSGQTPVRPRVWGLEVGYVSKMYHAPGRHEDIWGCKRAMNGLRMGLPYQPVFRYGLGLRTGLYYEYFFSSYQGIHFYEHCLNLPVQMQWRLPLRPDMSVYVSAGAAMDCGLHAEYVYPENHFDAMNRAYGHLGMPRRVQWSAVCGAGFRWKAIQVSIEASFGLNRNPSLGYRTDGDWRQRKLALSASALF